MSERLRVLDLFACVGSHAEGLHAAGPFQVTQLVELRPFRRAVLAERYPDVPIHDDVRTFDAEPGSFDVVVGGPPCQATSVAAAVHRRRSGRSLWPEQLRLCDRVSPQWIVVEQPVGSREWEAGVSRDLVAAGYHTARCEFAASDLAAPHRRQRVFILANRSLPRLAIAWKQVPREIERFAGLGFDGNPWAAPFAGLPGLDAGDERGAALREIVEAIGDSNPPAMMEVIGRAIAEADREGDAERCRRVRPIGEITEALLASGALGPARP